MTTENNFTLACPVCGESLILQAPKVPAKMKLEPDRINAVCTKCGGHFSYWSRLESHKKSSGAGYRRECTYTKIPDLTTLALMQAGSSIEVYCHMCGKLLILPPIKPFSTFQFRPLRTDALCKVCGLKFSYWGRLETRGVLLDDKSGRKPRRYCIYMKMPEFAEQKASWQRRLEVESKWFKKPADEGASQEKSS